MVIEPLKVIGFSTYDEFLIEGHSWVDYDPNMSTFEIIS